MNNRPDNSVIVVGAGLAGLMAAHAAAERGKNVTLLATGAGCLSIGGGCIDLLGYTRCPDSGKAQAVSGLTLQQLDHLPKEHPYQILGQGHVEMALNALVNLCADHGLPLLPPDDCQSNHWLPTIMGTLKPTYLCSASSNPIALHKSQHVLIVGIGDAAQGGGGIRDCHPNLIAQQLQRYPSLANKEFRTHCLPSPMGKTHRSLSALDVARYLDSDEGFAWCVRHLKPVVRTGEVLLLPPICGAVPQPQQASVWQRLQEALGCTVVEMLSLPPGVGGLRLRHVFQRALRQAGVRIFENTEVVRAQSKAGMCHALITLADGKERHHEADSFIVATGGILGGGIVTSPGKATEKIFDLPIDAPEDPAAWSDPDLFGPHAFASMGVRVNNRLCPIGAHGAEILHNVHFAGRSLGGYDYVFEKSGNGVALSTGWYAAQMV